MAETTETLYTVARGTEILTDLRRDVRSARGDLAAIEGAMRSAKLEPDVQLATVTRTTTLSDPAPYSETVTDAAAAPEQVATPEQQAEDTTATTKKTTR